MPNTDAAAKALRQNQARRARNRWRKGTMREAIKTFLDRLAHGSVDEARDAYRKAASIIDRTAQKGVIHKNQAARRKSRLNAKLKARALAKS